jgi:hypothetical protein
MDGARGSKRLFPNGRPDRLRNKEEEEALERMRKKMKKKLESAHPSLADVPNNEWGPHCQRRS